MPRDAGAEATDKILASLERRIKREFGQATKEAEAKWKKYMDSFDVADKKEAARLDAGEITKKEYQAWRDRHLAQGKHWEEMKDVIAKDYHNANLIAARMTNDTMADVYALNANYGTYLVEHGAKIDTGFTLYNHDSAEALLKEQWSVSPEKGENSFLPKPSAKKLRELEEAKKENHDVLWNKQKLQSAMMQGVLSGESLTALASRLAGVAQMDANQAIRNARTMTTNVQSKGRMDAFDRAAKLGVDLMDEWNSILDGATRHSHRHMHGERKPHDSKKPFSNGCRWPGDPQGPAAEVYNCRCRLISWVKGFEGNTVKENPDMGGMSFEQWQNAKNKSSQKIPRSVYDSVTLETASEDWFEYENANYMREYIKTGKMASENMYGDDVPVATRQKLAAEAELMQANGEKTKTKYKTVYRGMVMDEDEVRAMFTPGDQYVFDTLSATATEKKIAEIYMNPENLGGGVPVILEIQKSDGIYGFDRDGIELVVPKGSQFRVTRNYMDRDGVVHISLYSKKGNNIMS